MLEVEEVLDEVLHELVLGDHVALEAHHLAEERGVVLAEAVQVLDRLLLSSVEAVDLGLQRGDVALARVRFVRRRRVGPL